MFTFAREPLLFRRFMRSTFCTCYWIIDTEFMGVSRYLGCSCIKCRIIISIRIRKVNGLSISETGGPRAEREWKRREKNAWDEATVVRLKRKKNKTREGEVEVDLHAGHRNSWGWRKVERRQVKAKFTLTSIDYFTRKQTLVTVTCHDR